MQNYTKYSTNKKLRSQNIVWLVDKKLISENLQGPHRMSKIYSKYQYSPFASFTPAGFWAINYCKGEVFNTSPIKWLLEGTLWKVFEGIFKQIFPKILLKTLKSPPVTLNEQTELNEKIVKKNIKLNPNLQQKYFDYTRCVFLVFLIRFNCEMFIIQITINDYKSKWKYAS